MNCILITSILLAVILAILFENFLLQRTVNRFQKKNERVLEEMLNVLDSLNELSRRVGKE